MWEPIQKLKKVEPWGRLCLCGEMMRVVPSQAQTPLLDKETWRGIVSGVGHDYTKVGPHLERFDNFASSVLSYRCPCCGTKGTDYDAQFTEEEASEVAAEQNDRQEGMARTG